MAIGSYIFSIYFKVSTTYLIWANILFFVIESLVLFTIFIYAVRQEEVTDTRTIAMLINSIAKKSTKYLNQGKALHKMVSLGANLKDADYDRLFRVKLNLLRIEALRFWFSDNFDAKRTMIRLQEIAFYNAGVLC